MAHVADVAVFYVKRGMRTARAFVHPRPMVRAHIAGVFFVASITACNQGQDCVDSAARITQLEAELAVCRATSPTAPIEPSAPAPPAPSELLTWEVRESVDDLTGRTIISRVVQSRDEFELGFPYQGPQRAQLMIREHPRFGTDVILSVRRGQILCHVPRCSVDVVFGQGEPSNWRANPAESGSSEFVFLSQTDRFIRELTRSPEVRIAVTFFQNGSQTFVFPGLPANSGTTAPTDP